MESNYYDQISKVKKKIIRRYYRKFYQRREGLSRTEIYEDDDNPNSTDLRFGLWLASLKFIDQEPLPFQEYDWAWQRFVEKHKALIQEIYFQVWPNGGPNLPYTVAMTLLLKRGFRHVLDVKPTLDPSMYAVYSNTLPLVWPEQFQQHGEACQFMDKMGLPNHTTCPALALQKVLYNRSY